MTDTNVAGTGRFYDLGGAADVPVFSACYLNLPQGPILGTAFSPAGWSLDSASPPPTGLFSPVGPPIQGRPYSGIIANGDGTDITILFNLDAYFAGGPGSLGTELICHFTLARNGSPFHEEDSSFFCGAIFCKFVPFIDFTITGVTASAGDIFSAGVQFNEVAGLSKMPTGAGQQNHFRMSGFLTPPEAIPGQPPMRLHGAVVGSY